MQIRQGSMVWVRPQDQPEIEDAHPQEGQPDDVRIHQDHTEEMQER